MENSKYVVEMEPYNEEMPTPKSKKMVKTTTPGASKVVEILDEHIVLKPIDTKMLDQNELDRRFVNEDKDVVFSLPTFLEEAFVQTSFAFLGPLCCLGLYPFAR